MWNAICRPLLEYGCEVWAPVITERQSADLHLVQMNFLKSLFHTPVGMSNVFIRLEAGQERMETRWRKLVLGFIQRATRCRERLLWSVMEMVMDQPGGDRWPLGVRRITTALYFDAPPIPNHFWADQLMLSERHKRIDEQEQVEVFAEAEGLRSLALYREVRDWEKTSREYAWAQNHVDRASHRYQEHFYDDWDHWDRCLAKMRLRGGCT